VTAPLQNQTIHRTVLDNGIVVLVAENPAADIIAARILYEPVVVASHGTGWVGAFAGCSPDEEGNVRAVLFRNCGAGGIWSLEY